MLGGNLDAYQQSPGYQFALEEGQKAITNTAATKGGIKGGNTLKALTEYGQNLATGDFYNYLNQLAGMAGIGQTAVQGIGGVGAQTGASIGQGYANYGGALASGIAGQANTINSWLSQGANLGGFLYGGSQGWFKSGKDYKKNTKKIGEENGFNVYEFNYKDREGLYRGVIAEEVEKIMPEAVVVIDGIKMVNYKAIGVEFMRAA